MLRDLIPVILAISVMILAMVFHGALFDRYSSALPAAFGIIGGLFLLVITLPVVEFLRGREMGGAWRRRLEEKEGFAPSSSWLGSPRNLIQRWNAFLENQTRKRWDGVVLGWWVDSGLGSGPLSLIFAVIGVIGVGTVLGVLFDATLLLSGFVSFMLMVGFMVLIYSRARMRRQLFQDQFPGLLPGLREAGTAGTGGWFLRGSFSFSLDLHCCSKAWTFCIRSPGSKGLVR